MQRVNQQSPQDTLIQSYYLPTIRAAIEVQRHNPAGAVEILRPAEQYELVVGDSFNSIYPAYLRGLAYLQLGQGQAASAEFQKLLDHPAIVGRYVTGALAHLQLGRAQSMMGDKAAARKSYQDFLTLWKDADPDIPIYKQAKPNTLNCDNSDSLASTHFPTSKCSDLGVDGCGVCCMEDSASIVYAYLGTRTHLRVFALPHLGLGGPGVI